MVCILFPIIAQGQKTVRARDLGIPFDGTPGPLNAITDVKGVAVGHATIIRGDGALTVGEGPVRTGVTAIFPLGKNATDGVTAGWFALNGDGEMTGTVFLSELGELYGQILTTNTISVGTVASAAIEWNRLHFENNPYVLYSRVLPVVAETWDGFLNDIYGQHVTRKDVFYALDHANGGPVKEGNVGGGTGMRNYEFKGGIGTASRVVKTEQGAYTLGVLVQSNYGRRNQLKIAGVPVGKEITDLMPKRGKKQKVVGNSIIVIIATDAPLLPKQLNRIARRTTLGLGRNGSVGMNGSGDIFIAFSTGNRLSFGSSDIRSLQSISDMTPLFEATVQATEEAIINGLIAGETMVGINGNTVYGLPHDRVKKILKKYNRLEQ
ncbi:MAG: P1 family peptidase [Candidatus Marinimicrobia bacterium]|nr:P1 family peptidase [Candidatus Neomarinimicrobiota bacterium]MBL7009937.1 P1 family peptidase [Candidatus Neomarinimicrobiota bacterium]MBL7029764.1 P1 family peptidase [Candidatus Neomarinimicrobiota bacterium]